MKIVSAGYTDARIVPGELDNFLVLSVRHSEFGDRNGIEPELAENRRRKGGQTLV